MKTQLSIITTFVLLNLGIGRLFQESISVVCFSELSIIAVSGFFFWGATASTFRSWSERWNVFKDPKHLFRQGGIGLSAVMLHTLIGQALVIFLMTVIYNCTSPSFDLINASLTNNIAVNLLCYFSLIFHFHLKDEKKGERAVLLTYDKGYEKITVTKAGSKFFLSPEEVLYVEASNNCVVLHTEKGKFVKYQSLKSFQSKLSNWKFKRAHRSYLVNTDFIECVKKNKSGDGVLRMTNGDSIKFSRTYQSDILQ
ncbi:MAG: LytR/AlgR family response regulator transcription factor [Aurantibacter sp.]